MRRHRAPDGDKRTAAMSSTGGGVGAGQRSNCRGAPGREMHLSHPHPARTLCHRAACLDKAPSSCEWGGPRG
eukprot:9473567-Pyramimonas_sp.AAC.1